MEVKEHERDLKIHLLTVENQCIAESNKVLKGQVALLQEAILVGKNEWQDMKADWQRMKESTREERGVLNHKTPTIEGKTDEQTNNQRMKVREAENGGSTKNSRTWT